MATNIEDTDEFKWAVKVVIRRQLRELLQQLQEYGDEVAVLMVNTAEDMSTHFGTSVGEWFISEQRNLASNFLNFCRDKSNRIGKRKSDVRLSGHGISKSGVQEISTDQLPFNSIYATSGSPAKVERSAVSDFIDEVLFINIPDNLVGEISTLDVECLVGRLVASIISGKGRKDGGRSPATKHGIRNPSIGTVSRSGRKIKPRITDSEISPLTDYRPTGTGQDGKKLVERLESIDIQTLEKVKVKVGKGQFSSVTSTPIPDSEELEALAVSINNQLQSLDKEKGLYGRQEMKVLIKIGEDCSGDTVNIGLIKLNKAVEEGPNKEESHDEDDLGLINEDAGQEDFAHDDMGSDDFITSKMEVDDDDPEYEPEQSINKLKPDMPPTVAERMKSHLKRKKRKYKSKKESMKLACEHCGLELTGATSLKAHIQYMHLNIRKAECKVCFKKFWSNGKVNIHMLDVHTRQCHSCKEYVVESEPWKEGMNNRMVRMVRCKCGTDVPVFTSMGRKVTEGDETDMIESPKKKKQRGTKYACGECGKIFSRKENCEKHAKCHVQLTECICDHCGISFKYEASLKKHLQYEHGVMQNTCETCGKNFLSLASLRVHTAKTHNSVKLDEGYDIEKDIAKTIARAEMILVSGQEDAEAANGELDINNFEELVSS